MKKFKCFFVLSICDTVLAIKDPTRVAQATIPIARTPILIGNAS